VIYFFLDTTALHNSWRLDGPGWDSVRDAVELGITKVATSSITVAEIERQAQQDAVDVSADYEKIARALRRHYIDIEAPAVPFDAAEWRALFTDRLQDRHIDVVTRASPSHDALLQRDLARLPPFKESGEGYRDALIWLTFLQWISETEVTSQDELYFVSNNTRQFADGARKDGPLHKYLQIEVREVVDVNAGLLTKLEGVTSKIRPSALAQKRAVEATQHRYRAPTTTADRDTDVAADVDADAALHEYLSPSTEDLAFQHARAQTSKLLGWSLSDLNLSNDSALRGSTIAGRSIPPIEGAEITSVELVGDEDAHLSDVLDGTELWTVDVEASITVEGRVHKRDVDELPETASVLNADLSRRYVMVSAPLLVRLRYDVRAEATEEVEGQLVDATLLPSEV
jgi:hypothetical protein